MDKFDRIFELHKILSHRKLPVSGKELRERLECSRATLNRIIQEMRDYLNAPLKYDQEQNGYYYDHTQGAPFELPGLWLNSSELHALLVTQKLLTSIQPGILEQTLSPIRERIHQLLHSRRLSHPEIGQRIRILQIASRPTDLDTFHKLATALMDRKQIHILYHGRARDETTERDISPQRLVYYRNNWYLDAWCHVQKGLRSFSLDRIHPVYISDKAAREINESELQTHFADAYGIFGGKADRTAILRFSANAAKWVADEHWHHKQTGITLDTGEYELRVPYNNPTELIMDILKYGEDVVVLAPEELRRQVAEKLSRAAQQY
jgi:predicted DNA-binding transcriptional regulator YafY